MSFSNLDLKRVYYYVICAMAFFVLMWAAVDLSSASIGFINLKAPASENIAPTEETPIPVEKGDQFFDSYYQKKMLGDRFWDSLARLLVSSIIFGYCRFTVNNLEKETSRV
ncbi:hypothetical protein A3H38_00510 [candidate division WOR-1 bacterium RIFCSPLOWO2_02_FULL_46_20]|uniref:Uncharacterized protein n=1 Tax=candidate division WOR-1 bacterium RIFCSPLOWO2_02_FULL_46_20 TaxID=1802567 RepID=A0A1F4RFP6_UNCSA|nr:MAG: hypothetical protein A3J44_06515 [candidate division WOR-1 bacterium RIFCSPHIGHO2_02_FULL_45_12]OGC06997.1 MAG: hypothetical protein A3H38_00510 [candidate division WOR-1 bacterium RIFCSPLOWO2_02_FULL_46_20]